MKYFDSTSCDALCAKEREIGCCYLKTGIGCYWKPGGFAVGNEGNTGIAVNCMNAGSNKYIVFENQRYLYHKNTY